jgi:hypothetical protein
MAQDIHWQKYATRFKTFPARLEEALENPEMVVCIPVLAEAELLSTLESLKACEKPDIQVEVLLLFNKNDKLSMEQVEIHDQSWRDCIQWINQQNATGLQFKPVYVDIMPDPSGGVGWARKLVLDEAARRLKQDGIMLCLDADCTVEENYLKVIYQYFKEHASCKAASIYFEHRLDKIEESEVREAIAQYELHLRYLVHAMRWTGHPFAFQTVGSSMAVRRGAYLEHGGMNTRQAGEDFYFLQKFIEVGALHEIHGTCVYPSARISGRVPFGTGRAMQRLLGESIDWLTTDFLIFRLIKPLLQQVDQLRTRIKNNAEKDTYGQLKEMGIDDEVLHFLRHVDFVKECLNIDRHTTNATAFRKRFFRYFNSFMMIRYMHYIRDHLHPDVPVVRAARALALEMNASIPVNENTFIWLEVFRKMDKTGIAL